jgi:23S rRNA (uracil1939-C5)-methyltransferase
MARKRKGPVFVNNLEIIDIAEKGLSLGKTPEGRVVFVENVAPGDVVDVRVVKMKKSHWVAFPIKFHKRSTDRVEPFCKHYDVCGGCKWQHVTYESQIFYKEKTVRDALQRLAKVEPQESFPIIPCDETQYYRNKLEFSFSNKRWLTKEEVTEGVSNLEDVLGFHKAGAFDKIVNVTHCYLQGDPSNELRNTVRELAIEQGISFYDMRANVGMMRHILVRTTTLGETMLIVSFHKNEPDVINPFLDAILEKLPQLTTVFYCINHKVNDYVLDLTMHCYHGKGFIEEQLGDVKFRIGPKSFFQTNSLQAKVLYDVAVDFAGLTGEENVYDLYTGIGSIALYLAKNAKHVVGIEEVENAIKDAKVNMELNGIENCTFYAGDVRKILTDEFAQEHGKPDVVITDPPRAGMHPKVVEMFLKLEAPRIVYVSCNPATQARDIAVLSEKYDLIKIQPVDMFPHTHHIETVALLELKG